MFFGELPVEECHDCILAHSVPIKGGWLRKGTTLCKAGIDAIRSENISSIMVARLDADDISENEAASVLGDLLATSRIGKGEAATGRVNLFSQCHGILSIDRQAVDLFFR